MDFSRIFLVASVFGCLPTIIFTKETNEESERATRARLRQLASDCMERCGTISVMHMKKGMFECGSLEGVSGPWGPCVLDCMGVDKAKDQNKCLCDYCKTGENYKGFCFKPGPFHITKEQCEPLVCTGKVKFHGAYCAPSENVKMHLEALHKLHIEDQYDLEYAADEDDVVGGYFRDIDEL